MIVEKEKSFLKQCKTCFRKLKRKIIKDKNIGFIKLEGIIIDSQASSTVKKVAKAIKEAEERDLKVIVLKINSPGGTVGASQEIFDIIQKYKDKGGKVVASYGEVSASGGVYVGCVADKIVCNPGTITGSIGVIISSSNFKKLYDKIGIDSEVIKSGPYKDIMSTHRYLTEDEKYILQDMIDNTYSQFVEVVSKARNIEVDKVKSFADGRIFTGLQALELGLVDKIGSLNDAFKLAADLAEIEGEPNIISLTPKKHKLFHLVSSKLNKMSAKLSYSGVPLWIMPDIL